MHILVCTATSESGTNIIPGSWHRRIGGDAATPTAVLAPCCYAREGDMSGRVRFNTVGGGIPDSSIRTIRGVDGWEPTGYYIMEGTAMECLNSMLAP